MRLFNLRRRAPEGPTAGGQVVIHVDAKIINRDSEEKAKRTFVGYATQNPKEEGFEEVDLKQKPDAVETDAAELYAVDYALRRFEGRKGPFVLLCDNESVVLMLQRTDPGFDSKTRPILRKVWEELHREQGRFEVRQFPQNLADKLLNAKWNEIRQAE